MSHQRRRGVELTVYGEKLVTNRRGNETKVADLDNPTTVRAWVIPDRSSRAEVPGQQQINIVRVGIDASVDVTLWSTVIYDGREWDVAAPPSLHVGVNRHTRHYSVELRERPRPVARP